MTASADPVTGTAPLAVDFDGEATRSGRRSRRRPHLQVGLRRGRHDRRHVDRARPDVHVRECGHLHGDPHGHRRDGRSKGTATVEVQRHRRPTQCPTGPLRSDEFDGNALDSNRWTVIRPRRTTTVDGRQRQPAFPIDNGSIYGPGTSARNIIVQDTPEGAVAGDRKITTEPLTENYQQAGLRVYSDDDNWASVHMISAGGQRDFEFIYEADGNPRNEAADKLGGIPADSPTDVLRADHLRRRRSSRPSYSFDGVDVLARRPPGVAGHVRQPADRAGGAVRPGAVRAEGASSTGSGSTPTTAGGGGGGGGDRRRVRRLGAGIAAVGGRAPDQNLTVSGGALRIPAAQGDIYGGGGNAKNIVAARRARRALGGGDQAQLQGHRSVPPGRDASSTAMTTTSRSSAASRTRHGRREVRVHLRERGHRRATTRPTRPPTCPAGFPDDFFLKMTLGRDEHHRRLLDRRGQLDARRAARAAARRTRASACSRSPTAATAPEAAFDSLPRSTGPAARPGRTEPRRPVRRRLARQDALERDRARQPRAHTTVAGGELTITTALGDIYTGDTIPPPNNFILQSADHAGADWVIETKLLGHDRRRLRPGRPDRLRRTATTTSSSTRSPMQGKPRINRIELRSEVNGAIAAAAAARRRRRGGHRPTSGCA